MKIMAESTKIDWNLYFTMMYFIQNTSTSFRLKKKETRQDSFRQKIYLKKKKQL